MTTKSIIPYKKKEVFVDLIIRCLTLNLQLNSNNTDPTTAGLYSFGQWNVTFANTAARCLPPQNFAADLNGASHVIKLGELSGLGISRSFQIRLVT